VATSDPADAPGRGLIAITLDVMMSDIDGWSALAVLRQDAELSERVVCRYRSAARPPRILLVDDDRTRRERIRGWLDSQHWIVQEAENGREALTRLQQDKQDMIFARLDDARDGRLCGCCHTAEGTALAQHSRHRHYTARS
jgi:CheY-like chemotaxis protein